MNFYITDWRDAMVRVDPGGAALRAVLTNVHQRRQYAVAVAGPNSLWPGVEITPFRQSGTGKICLGWADFSIHHSGGRSSPWDQVGDNIRFCDIGVLKTYDFTYNGRNYVV